MKKTKEVVQEDNKQLQLGFKHPFVNFFIMIQKKFYSWFTVFELHKFAKDMLIWFWFSTMFSLVIYQFYIVSKKFETLPHILPILQTITNDSGKLLNTEYLYILPISSLLILILSYILSSKFYYKDKELILYFLLISTITTLIITISLLKIIG